LECWNSLIIDAKRIDGVNEQTSGDEQEFVRSLAAAKWKYRTEDNLACFTPGLETAPAASTSDPALTKDPAKTEAMMRGLGFIFESESPDLENCDVYPIGIMLVGNKNIARLHELLKTQGKELIPELSKFTPEEAAAKRKSFMSSLMNVEPPADKPLPKPGFGQRMKDRAAAIRGWIKSN
jgi:hypothetical protein